MNEKEIEVKQNTQNLKSQLDERIEKIEKLRQQVRHNDRCMDRYNWLKDYNNNDILYGWIFADDNVLDEDLNELTNDYEFNYVNDILIEYEDILNDCLNY